MGWTFEQLDASGLARPLPGVTKANAYILILVVAQCPLRSNSKAYSSGDSCPISTAVLTTSR